jgi:hypothetical protein
LNQIRKKKIRNGEVRGNVAKKAGYVSEVLKADCYTEVLKYPG